VGRDRGHGTWRDARLEGHARSVARRLVALGKTLDPRPRRTAGRGRRRSPLRGRG
jgi:hypothetical protein